MTKIEMNYMPKSNQSKEIMDRKIEHLKIPLEYDVQHSKNYFNDIKLIHHPLPDVDFEDLSVSQQLQEVIQSLKKLMRFWLKLREKKIL